MEEDNILINKAKNGDNESLDTLMNKYKNLVKKISRNYFIISSEYSDVVQEGMIGLFNAINKFDESKNAQFKTFATLCINRQILTAIKKAYKFNNELIDDIGESVVKQSMQIFSPEQDFIFNEEYKELLEEISNNLSHKEQTILRLFLQNKSYDEIAKELNINKKSVDNALSRIRNKLKYLNK